MKKLTILAITLVLSGCLGMPQLVTPVDGFELNNYLGKWYEICLLYTSPSPRDLSTSRMPSSA